MPEDKVTYSLTKKDFLEFMIYVHSSQMKRKTKYIRIIISVIMVALGVYSLVQYENTITSVVFITLGLLWYLVFPKINRIDAIIESKMDVDQLHKHKYGKEICLWFENEELHFEDGFSKGMIKIDGVKKITESKNLVLIENKEKGVLIIPKDRIEHKPSFWNQIISYQTN